MLRGFLELRQQELRQEIEKLKFLPQSEESKERRSWLMTQSTFLNMIISTFGYVSEHGYVDNTNVVTNVRLAGSTLEIDDKRYELTSNETNFIFCLLNSESHTATYEKLASTIWLDVSDEFSRANLSRIAESIRKKIELEWNDPKILVNERGVGYALLVK